MTTQPNNTSTKENPVGRFMVAAGAVIEHLPTGKILITQRSTDLDWKGGEWELTYGRIDQFEDAETGLRRELLEEIGLQEFEIKSVLRVWHIFRGPEKAENEVVGVTYHLTTTTNTIKLSNEHVAYQWVTPEEALSLIVLPGIKQDINKFIEVKQRTKQLIGKEVIGVGAGALIFNDEGKVLLALRGPQAKNEVGTWEIPGGAIEYGETVKDGLRREMKEELGIDIEVGEMVQLCDHILPNEHQHWVSPTYICKIVSGEPKNNEPGKCELIKWFTIEEAEQLPLSMVTKQDIEFLKNRS